MIQSQLFWCIQTDFERVLSEKLSSKCQDNNTLGTYCGVNDESWIDQYNIQIITKCPNDIKMTFMTFLLFIT